MFSKDDILYLVAIFFFGCSILLFVMQMFYAPGNKTNVIQQKQWQIKSIDTMKYSRDMARQDLTDQGYITEVNKQMSEIADTGANYVAIDTPYDKEFLPILQEWVQAARSHGLHVWFRGNFSGWEGWFGYSKISEQEHTVKIKQFILSNIDLFQNGDIFTSCPECENGINLATGDPTAISSYRAFLINEYTTTKDAFSTLGINVACNYFSMNADAARAIMDRQTTSELGGIVVIDHYVQTPEQLANDVSQIAAQSSGKIVLGEFGAPIPDINGNMTDDQQKQWLDSSLQLLTKVKSLIGVNYWVNKGGSTALWNMDNTQKPAVSVLNKYYQNY